MDVIGLPAFLVQVNGPRDFTFAALNAAHKDQAGLDPDSVVGKKPETLLPARLAETLIENYEECRATARPLTYEEHLHLPAGARWWLTTLSPIVGASGAVSAILGIATDISAAKEREFRQAEKLSEVVRQKRSMLGVISRSVDDVRGPFQSVLGLLGVLRDGFVDLGDGKHAQIDLCEEITLTALAQANALCQSADGLIADSDAPRRVDLGHLCRDIAALIDPDRRFTIGFPTCKVMADPTMLELLLRLLLENAAKHAHADILVTVSVAEAGALRFQVLDDGATDTQAPQRADGAALLPEGDAVGALSELGRAQALIDSLDGALTDCRAENGLAGIEFRLSGTLLEESTVQQAQRGAA